MPPLPATDAKLKRIEVVSLALHALIGSAILADLVFTEIVANRGDNDTVYSKTQAPSPSKNPNGRPTKRLILFGSLYIAYLALKAYQLTLPDIWYKYKKFVDEVCIILGGLTLIALIATTTLKFTYYAVFPVFGFLVIGRYLLMWPGEGIHAVLLEFCYIKIFQLRKFLSYCICSWNIFICSMKLKRIHNRNVRSMAEFFANQSARDACREALEASIKIREDKLTHWNEVIERARTAAGGGGDAMAGTGGGDATAGTGGGGGAAAGTRGGEIELAVHV